MTQVHASLSKTESESKMSSYATGFEKTKIITKLNPSSFLKLYYIHNTNGLWLDNISLSYLYKFIATDNTWQTLTTKRI